MRLWFYRVSGTISEPFLRKKRVGHSTINVPFWYLSNILICFLRYSLLWKNCCWLHEIVIFGGIKTRTSNLFLQVYCNCVCIDFSFLICILFQWDIPRNALSCHYAIATRPRLDSSSWVVPLLGNGYWVFISWNLQVN